MQTAIQETVDHTQSTDSANRVTLDIATPKTVDLQADLVRLNGMGLLSRLLEDKTTGKNITWATDQYEYRGHMYTQDEPILPELILGIVHDVVRARAEKSPDEQLRRTRTKGEVFTPTWVVEKMTAQILEDAHQSANNWKQFIDFRMLEITCGEGPFLATRYDTESGRLIPIHERAGLLDAKLREVTANTDDEHTWTEWAVRTYESTYGYEYQGDSLLIARVNMVMTFIEYFEANWGHPPSRDILHRIEDIIIWNLWQMDGLTGSTPTAAGSTPKIRQLSMFDDEGTEEKKKHLKCRIYDWRANCSQKMKKFDYIIGNPPYQESDGGAGASAVPIYDKYIDEIRKLDVGSFSLIIPAKWYAGGRGLDNFRQTMLSDKRLAYLVDFPDSRDVFPNVDIAGGVCYFLWKHDHNGDCKYTTHLHNKSISIERKLDEYDTFIRHPLALEIVKKVQSRSEPTLNQLVSQHRPFGLRTYVKPDTTGDLTLRYNGGVGPFSSENVVTGKEMIDDYKIIISRLTAEHAGQPDKQGQFRVLSTMEKLQPGYICTETYIVAGSFGTESEADNFMRYLKSKFVRFLVSIRAVSQQLSRNSFSFVPLLDYDQIWTDAKLYDRYDLSCDEIELIEDLIKEMV